MKELKRILTVFMIIIVVALSFSLSAVSSEFFYHCCVHNGCIICALYNLVQNFSYVVLDVLMFSLVIEVIRNYCENTRYRSFKLLPVELKVRIND